MPTAPCPVFLRPLEEDDITERYVSWFADPEVTRFLEARNISRQDAVDYLRAGRRSGAYAQYAVCRAEDGVHVGNVKIGPIKARDAVSDLVTVIGDRSAWGKGVATAAIKQAIELAFTRHGIRKLSASIDSLNVGSVNAYTRAGMAIEGVLPGMFLHKVDGGYETSDKVYVGCFNPAFTPDPARHG